MTKNLAQSAYKRDNKRIKPIPLNGDIPDTSPSVDALLISEEGQGRILKIIEAMSEKSRDIMILRYSLGKKPKVISKMLSIGVSEVYQVINRETKFLKRHLKGDGYFEQN